MSSGKHDGAGEIGFGRFRLDLVQRKLFCDGRPLRLGGRPLDVLCLLASAGGRIVTKDEFLKRLWPGRAVEEGNLHVHISALRRALGENGHSYVVTVPGRGYQLMGLERSEPAGFNELEKRALVFLENRDAVFAEAAADRRPGASSPQHLQVLERRQLTVLSCELIGAARLVTLLDPEDVSSGISEFYRRCSEVIASFGGSAIQVRGGITLAHFGYPQAGEHDVERAIRAALVLTETVHHVEPARQVLRARIGIATGPVLIGNLVKAAGSEGTLAGETVTLAAALRRTAEPGTVVIAENSSRFVGNLFDMEKCEHLALEEFDEPGASYKVLHPSAVKSRFEALRGSRLTPIVGRDEKWICCLDVGSAPRPGSCKSSWLPESLASGSPASVRNFEAASVMSRTRACSTPAHPTIRIVLSIQLFANWKWLRDSSTAMVWM